MKKLLIILFAVLSMSYLPGPRWDKGKIFERAELVLIGKVDKIISKRVILESKYKEAGKEKLVKYVRYVFYAVVEVKHTLKGDEKEKKVEVFLGTSHGSDKYEHSTTHNTQSRYFAEVNEAYLLELIKTRNGYEPLAYWNSLLKIAEDKGKISLIPGVEKTQQKLTLKEYEADRKVKLPKLNKFLVK